MTGPFEHPQSVLRFCLEASEPTTLVCVTATEGGGVRRPGALMAVTESGTRAGYVSGGCIDEDVALHAVACIESGVKSTLRYGRDSPFKDIALPCGGVIEIGLWPRPDMEILGEVHNALVARTSATLKWPDGNAFTYTPPLRLRLAGRGEDMLAMAKLAAAMGLETHLQSPDEIEGVNEILTIPNAPPPIIDDAWTAFLLLFHDREWESALLAQALKGDAFYIGAVGSRAAHVARTQSLITAGVSAQDIGRIYAPVGLIPAMRDASMLALSAMAEIVAVFHKREAA